MKCNVGKIDKSVRFTLALIIAALGLYFKSWWGILAVVPLFTGILSFCPLYKMLGINTCTKEVI